MSKQHKTTNANELELPTDIDEKIYDFYNRSFTLPTRLSTMSDLTHLRDTLKRICTREPTNKEWLLWQMNFMAKIMKLLDRNYLVQDAIMSKCKGSNITGYAVDVLPLHEKLFKLYFWPVSNKHMNYLDGDVRRADQSDTDWMEYKERLAKSRAGLVMEFLFKINSEPHRLNRVWNMNPLCTFLKWIVDAVAEYLQLEQQQPPPP
tara:strand:+ start:225 stop:839 length:615 start_codon:yes stop_codon:yes gene_type:complete